MISQGIPTKSTMDNPISKEYANLKHNFLMKAWSNMGKTNLQSDIISFYFTTRKMKLWLQQKGAISLFDGDL